MIFASSILGDLKKDSSEWEIFMDWFKKAFHTSQELYFPYCPGQKNSLEDLFGSGENIEISSGYNSRFYAEWKSLANKEFALIGIVKISNWKNEKEHDHIHQALLNWSNNPGSSENEIEQIIGLNSSIDWPWKHAEIGWHWPCEVGLEKLQAMAQYYAKVIEKNGNK